MMWLVVILAFYAWVVSCVSIAGSESAMLDGLGMWETTVIATIGEPVPGADGHSPTPYWMPGFPDGMAMHRIDDQTVRLFLNHELPPEAGNTYSLKNAAGGLFSVRGSRISILDFDISSRSLLRGDVAYDKVYNRHGQLVENAQMFGDAVHSYGGLAKLCSSNLLIPGTNRSGSGPVEPVYLTGEEWPYGIGGTFYALFPDERIMWPLPELGYGSWENAACVDTGESEHTALLLADDFHQAPLYLFIGKKNPNGNRLEKNGLSNGNLYVFRPDSQVRTPMDFHGSGATLTGHWHLLPVRSSTPSDNSIETDALGYFSARTLRAMASNAGAFRFSRPEDIDTNPMNPTQAVFASTGAGHLFPQDNWGTIHLLQTHFRFDPISGIMDPQFSPISVTIVYDGDSRDRDLGIRSPDNVEWSPSGRIFVQEDHASYLEPFAGLSAIEASIWSMDSDGGRRRRVATINRFPSKGTTDIHSHIPGAWESSGVLDVSYEFGYPHGTLLVVNVQAHGIHDGTIQSQQLYEGGQLLWLENTILTGRAGFDPIRQFGNPLEQDISPAQSIDQILDPDLGPFPYGVASGDPSSGDIVFWTHYRSPDQTSGTASICLEISDSPQMDPILSSTWHQTDSAKGWAIQVPLSTPGFPAFSGHVFFRFHDGHHFSVPGRTWIPSAKSGPPLELVFASCAHYEKRNFDLFSGIGRLTGVHAVVFLGDFIYESAAQNPDGPWDVAEKVFLPRHKAVTLDDYRMRYAQAVSDPQLLIARVTHPFIHVWDDHEIADGTWRNGALTHNPSTDGSFDDRRAAALKAFHEWCPNSRSNAEPYKIFHFPGAADLFALETRLVGRDPILLDSLDPALQSTDRSMLGSIQLDWLKSGLENSVTPWRLLANQVLFSELNFWWAAPALGMTPAALQNSLLDTWSGYPAERSRLIQILNSQKKKNTVIFTGDSHSSWAFEVVDQVDTINPESTLLQRYNPATGIGSSAVEFGVPSITSDNWDEFFIHQGHSHMNAREIVGFLHQYINQPISILSQLNPNPHLKYVDLMSHGFVHALVQPDKLVATYFYSIESVHLIRYYSCCIPGIGWDSSIHPIWFSGPVV
ncbi:MAG: alkaline phosphatase D family protein [Verrucomicrobia bacterium]|nr:alkaline phosphatase D family protein [Verrucomicrobiota bacterium]